MSNVLAARWKLLIGLGQWGQKIREIDVSALGMLFEKVLGLGSDFGLLKRALV